jgi:hypothetical protein
LRIEPIAPHGWMPKAYGSPAMAAFRMSDPPASRDRSDLIAGIGLGARDGEFGRRIGWSW